MRLVREGGVSAAQAALDLDVHESVLCKWLKEFAANPQHALSGQGLMKPEQMEFERLRCEMTKLKAERNILHFITQHVSDEIPRDCNNLNFRSASRKRAELRPSS